MALNVMGVVMMVFFYAMVLATGIWASVKSKREAKRSSADQIEMTLLGNRGIKLVVGMFTMTATWIGGGFFNVLAEATYEPSSGVKEVVLLIAAYAVAFILCGLVFTKPMRDRRFVTMLDPFQIKYGKGVACIFTVISLTADLIWVPTTLISLGSVMSVILDLSYEVSVWISSAVAITYTLLGGLYSVAYTDVIQLVLMFCSSWLCAVFILISPVASSLSNTTLYFNTSNTTSTPPWLGNWGEKSLLIKVDTFLFLAMGCQATQPVQQRILSSASSSTARLSCFAAALAVIVFAIPPAIIGGVATMTDWNQTAYGSPSPLERGEGGFIFPIALNNLTPPFVAILGISAVAAAVMSSTDSGLLSAATTFSTNIYKGIMRPQASQKEMQWVIRAGVVVIGVAGTALTTFQRGVQQMWYIGVGLTYVFMFPQLICVLFFDVANAYGCVAGFLLSLPLRLLCGWSELGIPVVLQLPGGAVDQDGVFVQCFPVNTLCMLFSMGCIVLFSYMSVRLLDRGVVSEKWDVLHVLKLPRTLPPMNTQEDDHDSSSNKTWRLKEKGPIAGDASGPMLTTW